jgi:hypothetical protein
MLKMELRTVRQLTFKRAQKLGNFCVGCQSKRRTVRVGSNVRGRTDLIGHAPGVRNC